MNNVILARNLNEEVVANLPKEVVNYFTHAQFSVNFSYTDTPSEGSILALNVGDKVTVRASGALGRTVVGEVESVINKMVRVEIDGDSMQPQIITFDEFGREVRPMDGHYAKAWAYDEYNFKQHMELNKYHVEQDALRLRVIDALEKQLADNPQLVRLLTTEDAKALLNKIKRA